MVLSANTSSSWELYAACLKSRNALKSVKFENMGKCWKMYFTLEWTLHFRVKKVRKIGAFWIHYFS